MSDVSDRIAESREDAIRLLDALDAGGLVSDVVILVKYVDHTGKVGLTMAWPQGQDWIARRGMIEILRDLARVTDDD